MITSFNNYIVESRKSKKSIDHLETLTPDELGRLLYDEVKSKSPDFQYMKNLIDVGCPIDARVEYGRTALNKAAALGNIVMVKFLLSKGADVNAKDYEGYTPLHWAIRGEYHYIEIVEFLISKGADVHARNNSGSTPLHIAAAGQYLNLINILISNGADVNARDIYGQMPWQYISDEMLETPTELWTDI